VGLEEVTAESEDGVEVPGKPGPVIKASMCAEIRGTATTVAGLSHQAFSDVAAEGSIAKPLTATTEAWVAIPEVGYIRIDVAIVMEDERHVVGPSKVMMEAEEGDLVEEVKEEVMEEGTASRGVVELTTGADCVSKTQDGPEVKVEAAVADGMVKTGVGCTAEPLTGTGDIDEPTLGTEHVDKMAFSADVGAGVVTTAGTQRA
jgi:hypothetical protein